MSPPTWSRVGRALLGAWPNQVAAWGPDAIAAYVEELQARGVDADAALTAIRCCDADQRFPPSAPELAALARRDPSIPTFAEMLQSIVGSGGVLKARAQVRKASWNDGEREQLDDEAAWRRADELHPLIRPFVEQQSLDRLRSLDLDDPKWGEARRKQLADAWAEHVDTHEHRELVAIATSHRGRLAKLDPLAALQRTVPRAQIAAGADHQEAGDDQPA